MEELEARLALSTVRWDGGGGDHSWHNPLNWSGDVLPGAADDVVIDTPTAFAIVHFQSVGTNVHSIFSIDPIQLSGGSISIASDWRQAASFVMNGGLLTGPGNLVVNGPATWNGGILSGTGRVQVLAGRTLTIGADVTLSRQIVNAGTLVWQAGNISADGGSILNLPGRTFLVRSPGSFAQTGAASSLVNQGLILRDGDSATTSTIGVALSNHPGTVVPSPPAIIVGTVDVRLGTLAFTGSLAQRVGETLVGGRWVVESAGTLLLPGGDIANASGGLSEIVLSGAGASFPAIENASSFRILRLTGGRAFTFANATDAVVLDIANPFTTAVRPMVVGELDVRSGIVVASGLIGGRAVLSAGVVLTLTGQSWLRNGEILGAGLLNVVGTLEWVSGVIAGPGQMLIGPTGALHLRADTETMQPSNKWLTRRTVNYGTIEWDDRSGWQFQLGTELVNRGTLNLDSFGFLSTTSVNQVPVPAYITNFGTLNKGGAGDLTLRGADGGVRLANLGTVNVGVGRLFVFGGAGASGSWQAAAGAELVFGGLPQSLTGAVLGGFGRIRFASTALLISVTMAQNGDMVITPAGTVAAFGSGDWSRAVVTVQGGLYVGAGADVRVHGDLVNSGRVTIDASAVELKVIGDVTLLAPGVLTTVVASPSVLGRMVVEGDIALAGTLWAAFLAPADPGVRFEFLRAATFSGAFGALASTGLGAGRGIEWQWIHQGLFDERGQIVVV